jgi:selenocysteine-specific translation elongation factor
MAEEKLIGKIIHYYTNIGVGIVELSDKLNVGDKIHVKGSSTDFEQTIDSMQIEHENVQTAKAGESIGVKLNEKVREGDEVFKVTE